MRRDEQAMYALMVPWLFIIGVCSVMIVTVVLDLIFNLGLSN